MMGNKRNWLLALLIAVCAFALTACGKEKAEESDKTAQTAAPTQETSEKEQLQEEAAALCEEALTHSYTLERKVLDTADKYAAPSYWAAADGTDEEVLMDAEEIAAYNAEIVQDSNLKVVDLTKEVATISADEVANLIESYDFGDYTYLDGGTLSESDKEYLENRRNLDALSNEETVAVGYGLITDETAVRSFPAIGTLMSSATSWDFDYFQQTTLKVGEGVRIYHESTDGEWLFVQAKNYYGWVQCDNVARCDFDEMQAYLTAEDFVLVTAPTDLTADGETVHLSMGSRLGYDEEEKCAKRPAAEDGALRFDEVSLSDIEYHIGYLPYTTVLVLDQAMKLLNTGYGWGGKDNLLDCSSTMLSVYECFGFSLPRDTSKLSKCTRGQTDVSTLGEEEKREVLAQMRPGCMLLMNGHVMMYLGIEDDVVYTLHAFTKYFDDDGNKQSVMQCTITPCTIHKANGSTYLEAVHTILEVQ